jgi:uncharacterized protein
MKREENILQNIEEKVRLRFENEGTGHDWWHIHRVRKLALQIAKSEGADLFLVELAALLHDIADHKLHGGDVEKGLALCENWLIEANCDREQIQAVLNIVKNVSYKGAKVKDVAMRIEGQIVQDADRIDAIGAIGIARAFNYGGNQCRLIYHPEQKPEVHDNFEAYKNSKGHTINHFYEKLLLLKDRLNTATAKQIAQQRHDFMIVFLNQFYAEWEGRQ